MKQEYSATIPGVVPMEVSTEPPSGELKLPQSDINTYILDLYTIDYHKLKAA